MSSTMIIPSKSIQSKNIHPPINSWDKKKIGKVNHQPSYSKHQWNNIEPQAFNHKKKLGAISYMYMSKTSKSSKIQKIWSGALRIFPLDGQIQEEVVVGTTPSQEKTSTSWRTR